MKKIKKSITKTEHEKILTYLRGNTSLRANTKQNLQVVLTLLYFTGMRINEVQQLTIADLKTLIKKQELIIETFKTKRERTLYISKDAVKAIKKLFDYSEEENEALIIRSKGKLYQSVHHLTFIGTVNSFIQEALNSSRYSSHSYRQNLITEMAKTINTKFIKDFIGHSDVKTTMRYIKATESDLKNCVVI